MQPQRLRRNPRHERSDTHSRFRDERRVWQVEWQKDEIPEEILARADFVEGDEGEGLGEQGRGEVVFGECKGQEEGGEEELRDECETREIEGWSGAGGLGRAGGGQVEKGVVRGEVVAVVEARDMMQEGVLDERMTVDGVHEHVEGEEGGEGGKEEGYTGSGDEGGEVVGECSVFGVGGGGFQCP